MTFASSLTTLVAALVVYNAIAAAPQERPTFRTGTRLVEISAIVTDKDRNSVPGLRAGDFEVFDNGQLQSVELFSVEDDGASKPTTNTVPASADPGEFSNKVPRDGGVTVILFDRLNTSDTDQMYAREHVAKFLEQIRPEDRIGLYALDGGGFRVIHDFTNDAAALVRAMNRVRAMTSVELAAITEAPALREAAGAPTIDSEIAGLFAGLDGFRHMQEHYMGLAAVTSIDALEAIAHHLGGVRGRKNLIWVSSGFRLSAFAYAGRGKTTEISRATRALNDANVAIYTVDARGLVGTISIPGQKTFTTQSTVSLNQDILQSVSERTGARAFLNTNDINGAVRRAADDARLTYVLGYYPTNDRSDGHFHHVRVKVNRPGLDVRHREGYFAQPTPKQVGAQRAASLVTAIHSPIDASGLGLTVRIEPTGAKPSEARLTLRLDPGSVPLEQRADRWIGKLDLVVAQLRADGTYVRSVENTIDVSVSKDGLAQVTRDGVNAIVTVAVLPDAQRLRIVVRDIKTGNLGAVGITAKQVRTIVP